MKQDDNKQIDMLKKNYGNISVPKEAKDRMIKGVAQAKKEQNGAVMIKFFRNTGTGAAAAMLAIAVLTNINPSIANAMEQIPVIGAIARVVTIRTYKDKSDNFEADIQIPRVTLEGTGESQVPANKSIEEYADELIAMYEKDLAESNGQGHYGLDSTYQVVTDTDKYLSIRIDTTLTMASGTQFVKIFTINKITGNVVNLSGLLKDKPGMLEAINRNIKEQMTAQMAADEGVMYFYNSDMPDEDFKGLSGNESYYFNDKGELVITFDEYHVAPGYMGAVEFTIPSTVTGGF